VLAILLAHLIIPSAAFSGAVQGDKIINNATITTNGHIKEIIASVTVSIVIRTQSAIEALIYSPALAGADRVNVSTTAYRTGSSATDSFVNLSAPVPVGTTTSIDLSNPVPLAPSGQIHQGEPLYIRVTDQDQNLNSTVVETLIVTIKNPANSDIEVVRLTETGPNTGVFVGYVFTANTSVTAYNGTISAKEGDILYISYVDVADSTDTSMTTVLVDPVSIVFDAVTGLPINGAKVTIIDDATGKTAVVLGDDGVSTFPSEVTSGANVTDSSGRVYTVPAGGFRFPFVFPGSYKYNVTPPSGYAFPSIITKDIIQTLPGAPFRIVTGSHGETFDLNPGPAVRIDIPVDPAPVELWLQKTAGKDTAGWGDFIPYQLTVANKSSRVGAGGVQVTDIMPMGFRYRSGSAKLNGVATGNPTISKDGRTLTFDVGSLDKSGSATIDYMVEVTAGTQLGDAINNAVAFAATGEKSNKALVIVKIQDDFMRTRSFLMGRVTTGDCNDETGEGTDGLEGVRIYLEDGTFVISDKRGMYHFEAVRAGLHVVQMDLDSLPKGYEVIACTQNSRFAGRAFSQFVETQGGALWRADFHVRSKVKVPEKTPLLKGEIVTVPEKTTPVKGEIVLELSNVLEKENIVYKISVKGNTLPARAAKLNIILPVEVVYKKGSAKMDGAEIADPLLKEKTELVFNLGDLPAGQQREIIFAATPSNDVKSGTIVTKAYLAADSEAKAEIVTPTAETILQVDKKEKISQMPDIILRPHFPVRSAELNAEDHGKLDELAQSLAGVRVEKIRVVGYTDNIPIAARNRVEYADNQALSLARAGSVGHYLMDKLKLPEGKMIIEGKGSDEPIADNRTQAGRALNRRVEIRINSISVSDTSTWSVVKEQSGEMRVETNAIKDVAQKSDAKAAPDALSKKTAADSVANVPETTIKDVAQKSDAKASPDTLSKKTAADSAANVPETTIKDVAQKSDAKADPDTLSKKTAADSAADVPEPTVDEPEGILNPADNDILANAIDTVRVCLDSRLTPRLLVDSQEVSSKNIGFTMKDTKTGKTLYTYIGVDFGKVGPHTLEFQGIDPFGNARFKKTLSIKRSGEIVAIRVKSTEGNVADGKTPVKIRLELYDSNGTIIPAGTDLEIREGTLSPLKKPDLFALPPAAGSHARVQMSKDGEVLFQPVTNSGPYNVVLGYNKVTAEVETYVQPNMRDWILVGLAEGTAGYNTVSGNMENMKGADVDENLYKDGRVALFAKGQIKGKWLVTMAYDTAKTKAESGNSLFQTINPETYFTLYGDASQQQYEAASQRKLYLKIERNQFYAMFGDYDTGMTITELSRYSRRLTGFKTELQSKYIEVNAFASETDQLYMRDEIPGDGTSGIYRLSRKNILSGSEKITIEVRDRFRSEVLVSSRSMNRFADYSIDYDSGAVIFKEPVFSRDENFNPIKIVAEYETISNNGNDYTYGGRAGFKLPGNKLKVGGSYIHEGQGDRSSNLYGTDASVKLDKDTKLRAEYAKSKYDAGADSRNADAYLVEALRTTKQYDAKAYFRELEVGFGMGQQPDSEAGTRKYGVEGKYRFNEIMSASANVYRQYTLLTDATRDMAEGKFDYNTKKYGASIGFLQAIDELGDGSKHKSDQVTMSGKILTLYDRLTLGINHAQSVGNNDNTDFPTRTTLSAELAVTKTLTLLAAQEFTWGSVGDTQNTRIGIRSSPWKGAELNSSVERQFNENDERVFAHVGLKQSWQINKSWKVDAGMERSQTVSEAQHYQFNKNVPPASGNVVTASGTNEDFTAVSGGATYQVKNMTWDNRLEFRKAETEDKWGLMSGIVKEVDKNWAWSGRLQLSQTNASSGIDTTNADLRYGLVYRPPQTKLIALNRCDLIINKQSGSGNNDLDSRRIINNLMLNYRPYKETEISVHYGAKYVQEKKYGDDFGGYTDLWGAEGRYDINKEWDIGLQGSILHSWNASNYDYSSGISVGYNIAENAWLSLGYNLLGFEDKDFSQANFTAQGPFVRFRFKFDQKSVRDAAKWLNGN
jgi:uncharacterized repeat protein (TIGR01451 family)